MSADYTTSEPGTIEFRASGRALSMSDAVESALTCWKEFSAEDMFPWESVLSISDDNSAAHLGGPRYIWDLLVTVSATPSPARTT